MLKPSLHPDQIPYGWVEISGEALRRLRSEMDQQEDGVVDEMGVLAIHAGYADRFFPGTSVQHARPRYLYFTCWNLLALARNPKVTAANLLKRKDEADLWVTERLVASRLAPPVAGQPGPDMGRVIGVSLFQADPTRLPAQRVDFIYWSALTRWGFYASKSAPDRARLHRRWRGNLVRRVGEEPEKGSDEVLKSEPLAEIDAPPVPADWLSDDVQRLDFELEPSEAQHLRDRLSALRGPAGEPVVLARAAELCAERPPAPADQGLEAWEDPLIRKAARAVGELERLERAGQASALALFVRATYAALVEALVEETLQDSTVEPLRHYRTRLQELASDGPTIEAALGLKLSDLDIDVPKLPAPFRDCLVHLQAGLHAIQAGRPAGEVLLTEETHRLFVTVEKKRKGERARLSRTSAGAARRVGLEPGTIGVYGLDYRWPSIRYLLSDLHRGLMRA